MAAMPTPSGAVTEDIPPLELQRRIALIKRFKELLKTQRDRFRTYLDTLDKQKNIIEAGTADDLLRHVELEEKIISDIFSIQKVIDPLEKMYDFSKHETRTAGRQGTEEVSGLKEALKHLKAEAAVRSERNKTLLSRRMEELRSEIKSLKNNPYARRPNGGAPVSNYIDISG